MVQLPYGLVTVLRATFQPKMVLCLYFSAPANIIILQLDFCGNDGRFCWLLAFPDEE
jgi:hypothetical protein